MAPMMVEKKEPMKLREANLALMSDFLTKKAPDSVMMMALSLEWMRVI